MRFAALIVVAVLAALAIQLLPGPQTTPARADDTDIPPLPKAVFIVGPTNGLTDENLVDAEKMAQQAEAAGMDVRRVFFPHATWDNVLANIQDANLVVYMGHGYGWPSHYTKELTESRQNGMGLNKFDGSGKSQYKYYGADRIRESIHLAPNAIVFLNHLCYASGNGEPGMAIPGQALAAERVDNMASGWLAAGARAVFAYGWTQSLNYPNALMNSDATMDELFMTVAPKKKAGTAHGFVGWKDVRLDSLRTPGAVMHLDPHKKVGYYRSLTGDLAMTTADWRSAAAGEVTDTPPDPTGGDTPPDPTGGDTPPDGTDPTDGDTPPDSTAVTPPEITSLTATAAGGSPVAGLTDQPVAFHPNADGIDDELLITHTVTRDATLQATISDSAGKVVHSFSLWSRQGTSTSRWDGRNSAGSYVADGTYTLTYVPRDASGVSGTPVSTNVLVLTAIKVAKPSVAAFYSADQDKLAKKVKFKVTLNKSARVSWQITDAQGDAVRTVYTDKQLAAGKTTFKWNGKDDAGRYVPDGVYTSVVTATTSLGTYTQRRTVHVGAFRLKALADEPRRGQSLTLTLLSAEPLKGRAKLVVSQPGVAPFEVTTTRISSKKFKVTIKLSANAAAGQLQLLASGKDKYGGQQSSTILLPLN